MTTLSLIIDDADNIDLDDDKILMLFHHTLQTKRKSLLVELDLLKIGEKHLACVANLYYKL